MPRKPTAPTRELYPDLQEAFDHFNRQLFSSSLPQCLITLQRHKGAGGYFSPERFAHQTNAEIIVHEIALNPQYFEHRTPAEILSILVHEMAHLWQQHHGTPPRRCYHNQEWARKMIAVGLHPSHTGEPGGKTVGQRMSHYIIEGGPFDRACAKLLATHPPTFYRDLADEATARKKRASKTKYTCPDCEQNAWAKPGASLICGECQSEMIPEGNEPVDDD